MCSASRAVPGPVGIEQFSFNEGTSKWLPKIGGMLFLKKCSF
jgi:hypothetical protein